MKFKERLNQIVSRHKELTNLMSHGEGLGSEDYVKMSKEFAELDTIAGCVGELREAQTELEDLNKIVSDPEIDQEMKQMAEEEVVGIAKTISDIEQKLKLLLLPKDIADQKNAILEIRAGTGGDEAALFAAELLRMYQKFCDKNRRKFEKMSLSQTDIGGIKFRMEHGVHCLFL